MMNYQKWMQKLKKHKKIVSKMMLGINLSLFNYAFMVVS